jgi:hypothetical protein
MGMLVYILTSLFSGSETVQASKVGSDEFIMSAPDVVVVESATERSTRMIKESLGVKTRKDSEAAVIVELMLSEVCSQEEDEQTALPILYRFDSPTIRTSSINQLRSLVTRFRRCENSEFHMSQNTQSRIDSKIGLAQMRYDELKYFFTQNSVPTSALHYSKIP